MSDRPGRTSRRIMLLAGVGVLAAGAGLVSARYLRSPPATPQIAGFLWPGPRPLGDFSLDAADGSPLDQSHLEGHWSFLFFGYTHCPDVCPTTLSVMHQVMTQLRGSDAAEDVQVVFVSVDPQRDTPDRLGEYTRYFDREFLAASAADERLQRFTRKLGVLYRAGEADAQGNYEVDHTASILLVDPRGRLVGIFSAPHEPGDIARRFGRMREHVEASA